VKSRHPFIVLILILVLGSIAAYAAKHTWIGKTLEKEKVELKWGRKDFDATKFKNGDIQVRAAMAYALLSNAKQFEGRKVQDIWQELGEPDGYYFSDAYPAYLIQRGKNNSEESWQVVFLVDQDRKVTGVIVHKNCCEK